MPQAALMQTNLPLPRFGSGKVRDTYDLGDRLLMVTTDRLSAFDVVLPNGIPGKGEVLTRLSAFWFDRTRDTIPNHLLSTDTADLPEAAQPYADELAGRFMLVRKAKRLDFECVARGYLAGSAWQEYRESGSVSGHRLPEGLRQAEELPEPIFTPATKAESGHDQNISLDELKNRIGEDLGQALADASIAVYTAAAAYAASPEHSFEFGLCALLDGLATELSARRQAREPTKRREDQA